MTMDVLLGIMVPFFGTAIGAAVALVCKRSVLIKANKLLVGFAAGVMLAASIWSLIMPAVEMAQGKAVPSFVPAAVGFLLGVIGLTATDGLSSRLIQGDRKNKMLVLAVTVHNVPEGMAVGAIFAGLLAGSEGITLVAAMSLSIGVALQNIPEGAIVGLPLISSGGNRIKAFWVGVLSGVVEPIAAAITIALYVVVVVALPYLLSFAAGAMVYVVIKELASEIQEGNLGIMGLAVGFTLMMVMDLSL